MTLSRYYKKHGIRYLALDYKKEAFRTKYKEIIEKC